MAVKSLYRQDIKAIGLKLLASSLFPFLYISIVVDSFQTDGICFCAKHLLKIHTRTLQSGSTCLRWRYSTRSFPGAELDMFLSFDLIHFSLIGSITVGSPLAVGTCRFRDSRTSSILIWLLAKVLVKWSLACSFVPEYTVLLSFKRLSA